MEYPGIPENVYQYQNMFNYSVWTPNTEILLTSVPWDSSYRDIVRFPSEKVRDAWFASRPSFSHVIDKMIYLKFNEPIRINLPFSYVQRFNYVVVRNSAQPILPSELSQPDTFYYFISDVQYVSPNVTQLNIQLDVWQTYGYEVRFNQCYVERGHIGIANENSTIYNMADYLIEPEGLNIGEEYDTLYYDWTSFIEDEPIIVIQSTTSLTAARTTTIDGVEGANLVTATGDIVDGVPSGCECYGISIGEFMNFMRDISAYPWVSQGITYIAVLPDANVSLGNVVYQGDGYALHSLKKSDFSPDDLFPGAITIENWRQRFINALPARYRSLTKMMCYPYSLMELTTLNGGEIIFKPECAQEEDVTVSAEVNGETVSLTVPRDNLTFAVKSTYALPNPRLVIYPMFYNGTTYTMHPGSTRYNTMELVGGENLDFALTLSNWPQLSLVNNMYTYYLASNQFGLNYSFQSADWSQNKALTAATTSYNQTQSAIEAAWATTNLQNENRRQMNYQANERAMWSGAKQVGSGLVDAATSAVTRNPVGAVGGLVNAGLAVADTSMQMAWNNETTALNNALATDTTAVSTGQQQYVADTNRQYAEFAAKGDYATTIQGIQAKVQDARLTQPSTSGQQGGDTFNLSNGYVGLLVKYKRMKPNYITQIGEFWLRYGYYVNRWITPPDDLMVMGKFTYWKMQSVYLDGGHAPELFKETIRGIFEKGVTVWYNPDDIGVTDNADNPVREGVAY